MKKYILLSATVLLALLCGLVASCLNLQNGNESQKWYEGTQNGSEPQKWYEGVWNHEDGDFQLIISRTDWILKWHQCRDYDEKGKIAFNENTHTFTMISTHYWDAVINNWEKNDHHVSGSYTISGKKWTIIDCTLDDFIGVWTK